MESNTIQSSHNLLLPVSDNNYIYKFKKIHSAQDIEHLYDILTENRLYFPRYSELNDPLEGTVFGIYPDGYAGMTIALNAGEEASIVTDLKDKYRILSFTINPFSPQMWAHYAGNYEGICLCFLAIEEFSHIKAVQYCDRQEIIECDDENLEDTVYNNFYYKQKDWRYEEEYRFVEKTEEEYFRYVRDHLKAVIIGEKLSSELVKLIRNVIPENVQVFRTRIEAGRFKIVFMPLDYQFDYDGTKPYCIDSKSIFESRIEDLKYPSVSKGRGRPAMNSRA